MKKAILVLACLFLLAGCSNVKLTNGENALVTFEEGGISSDELYETLKETYGAETVTNLIDKYLLDKKYETTSDETTYINQSLKTAKSSAESMGVSFELYATYYYGVASEKAYKEYVSLNYKRSLWVTDYSEETVTDKQINEYYETESVGDIEASQILITVDTKSGATDAEKTQADTDALNKAKEVITELKNGKDFASLAKTYSKDSTTSSKGGSLGKVNVGDVDDTVWEALKALKDGSYSTTPVKGTNGYYILYRTSQDKKSELDDDLKSEIRTIIGKEIASDSTFYIKAMKALREKNKMKILDSDLNKAYETLVAQTESQAQSSNTSE